MSVSYWFVPHTHWDREWYLSFQDFRWRLAAAIDAILDTLAADRDFTHFMLDGQTVVLEDYLELRPDRTDMLRDFVRAGRLAVGPWYVQPDDVLVTGEALVRNLERGFRMARELGGAMSVGYLPDSFGHCAALPSILRGFGMESASLMRGAGPEMDKVFFGWSARDGSRVLVAYLVDSYGNGADLVMEPAALRDGLSTLAGRQKGAMIAGVPLLVMNGMDHRSISAGLPRALVQSGLRDSARIGPLSGYIDLASRELAPRGPGAIPEWAGELRSCWRFTITTGCISSRAWTKREDQAISSLLEREAEPLSALSSWLGGAYPHAAMDVAWRHLLQNQPHDSLCGCSIDQVHEDMRYRYAQARGLGENIAREAAATLVSRVDCSWAEAAETVAVAVNPGPGCTDALLSFPVVRLPPDPVLVDREGRPHPLQLLSADAASAVFFDERFTPRQLTFAMGMVKHGKLMELSVTEARASWESKPSVLRIDLELVERGHTAFDWDAWVRETVPLLETPGLSKVHAVGLRSGTKTALFTADLPSFGARAFAIRAAGGTGRAGGGKLRAGRGWLENKRTLVRVNRDGSLEVTDRELGVRLEGANGIVDDGDRGDEYNYDPVPGSAAVTAPCGRVAVDLLESGPVRATLRIRTRYRLPESLGRDRSSRSRRKVEVAVVRRVSLQAESSRIELRTEIDNTARDHRMRVVFPLADTCVESLAGGTFGAVRRPARPPAPPPGLPRPFFPELGQEEPTASHPFTGFVACSAGRCTIAAFARGMREYEVLEGGREIAVTLLRSVGWLSRADLASRTGNAGPDTPTPGAQEIGKHIFEYALRVFDGPPDEALLSREWEDYRVTQRVLLRPAGTGDVPDGASLLEARDPDLIFSSLRRLGDGAFSLRLYDAGGTARSARIRFRQPVSWARKTRLDGSARSPLRLEREAGAAAVTVPVQPWEIVTIEFGGAE
jgi:hypothetical protein